jgi:hypothetical protein
VIDAVPIVEGGRSVEGNADRDPVLEQEVDGCRQEMAAVGLHREADLAFCRAGGLAREGNERADLIDGQKRFAAMKQDFEDGAGAGQRIDDRLPGDLVRQAT